MKKLNLTSIQGDSILRKNMDAQTQVINLYQGLRRKFNTDLSNFIYNPGSGYSLQWHIDPIPTELSLPRIINWQSPTTNEFTTFYHGETRSISFYYDYQGLTNIPAYQHMVVVHINYGIFLLIPINGQDYRLKCLSKEVEYNNFSTVNAYGLPSLSSFFTPSWQPNERLYIQELGNYKDDVDLLLNCIWYELTFLVTKAYQINT